MRYKIIPNTKNDVGNVAETILLNRGIEDWKGYLSLTDDALYSPHLLKNISDAVTCFLHHIEAKNHIHIVVDCDPDGYTSAAIVYSYIKILDDNANISYSIHSGKEHGLSDDIEVPDEAKLVIIPDAGSNDIEQCKLLFDMGKDVIILDHHISDQENPYAIVVNSQNGYPNKHLSGVGVTYKFLQICDEEMWTNGADRFIDLVAIGTISDVMDIRSFETKRLCEIGLRKIKNKLLQSLVEKQSFSIGDKVTITGVQFYITPLLNSLIRVGSMEEKDLLFRALIETDEVFLYKKRGEEEEQVEDIYQRVARLSGNAKAKQDKIVAAAVENCENAIQSNGWDTNKIMFVDTSFINVPKTVTGLVANKLAEKYGKPCLLLRGSDNLNFSGSGRNNRHSPIANLREVLLDTGMFNDVAGHGNAFGCSISADNVISAILLLNNRLSDCEFENEYLIDFEIDSSELNLALIKSIVDINHLFGTNIEEPYLLIRNMELDTSAGLIMGKDDNSWKIVNENDIAVVKFKCQQSDEILSMIQNSNGVVLVDIIGKVSINAYKGILTPQLIVNDYEILGK